MLDVLRGIDPQRARLRRLDTGRLRHPKAALGEHGEGVWLAWTRTSARHDGTSGPKGTPERMWRGIKPQRCGWRYLERLAGSIWPMDSPDLHAAFDEALDTFAAAGLPEGEPPPQPWHENIKPIVWPEMMGRYAPAATVRGEGLDTLWLRDLALRPGRHRQVDGGPNAGHGRIARPVLARHRDGAVQSPGALLRG